MFMITIDLSYLIAPTSLSLEEQRLIQSIEKLNQRLKGDC